MKNFEDKEQILNVVSSFVNESGVIVQEDIPNMVDALMLELKSGKIKAKVSSVTKYKPKIIIDYDNEDEK